jgi:hypothetical protein
VSFELATQVKSQWEEHYSPLRKQREKTTRLEKEVANARAKFAEATEKKTRFFQAHKEYSSVANTGTADPCGLGSVTTAALPTSTGKGPASTRPPPQPSVDPELQQAWSRDPRLGGLAANRSHLEALRSQRLAAIGAVPPPANTAAQLAELKAKLEAANTDVDKSQADATARKQDWETAKAQYGAENHVYINAKSAFDAATANAARALATRNSLQGQIAALEKPVPAPTSAAATDPEVLDLNAQIREYDARIAGRQAVIRSELKGGTQPAPSSTGTAPTSLPVPAPLPTSANAKDDEIVKNTVECTLLVKDVNNWKNQGEEKQKELDKAENELHDAEGSGLIKIEAPADGPLTPVSSKKVVYLAIGMAVAFLLALLYPAARVLFNDTIIDAQDLEGLQLIPVLGVVPKIPLMAASPNAGQGKDSDAAAAANRGAPGAV